MAHPETTPILAPSTVIMMDEPTPDQPNEHWSTSEVARELGVSPSLVRTWIAYMNWEVRRSADEISLQPREFRLLEYLMKHAGQVVTRTMLLENVWDYHFDPQTNVIDVHISRLRSKIDKGFSQPLLHTVRGAGYMIRDGAR